MTQTEEIENAMRKVMAEYFPRGSNQTYMTTKDVMLHEDISRQTLSNWIKKGILKPALKEKNRHLFLREDVESINQSKLC